MADLDALFDLSPSPERDRLVKALRTTQDPVKRKAFLVDAGASGLLPVATVELLITALGLETA